jgi:hypothetical protein
VIFIGFFAVVAASVTGSSDGGVEPPILCRQTAA